MGITTGDPTYRCPPHEPPSPRVDPRHHCDRTRNCSLRAHGADSLAHRSGRHSPQLDFRFIISEVLFMLVMVELVRLLVVYLRDHHVAVDFMVELGIVSTLREVVLRGVVELEWQEIIALALFLVALGMLLRFGDLRLRLPVPSRTDHQRVMESENIPTSRSTRHAGGAP
jgi:uncharacterized membrane protein (DUF373 family)